jgi:hypothetical protein
VYVYCGYVDRLLYVSYLKHFLHASSVVPFLHTHKCICCSHYVIIVIDSVVKQHS